METAVAPTYSTGRQARAVVGIVLSIVVASGGTTIMNAVIPSLLQGMNITLTTFMIGPTLATICAFIMSAVGSKLLNALTPKWAMLTGVCCGAVTLALVASANGVGVWILANILNGVVLAFATYAAAGGLVAHFCGAKTQQVFGIVYGCVAALVALWTTLFAILLSTGASYRTLFYIFAVCVVVIGFISVFFLIGKVPKIVIPGAEKMSRAEKKAAKEAAMKDVPGFTFGQAIKTPSLWFFIIAMLISAWAYSGVTSYGSTFFVSFGADAATAALFMSIYSWAAAILRFISGFFVKKFGPAVATVVVYIVFAIGIVCLLVWSGTQVTAFVWIGMICCAFVSMGMMLPSLFIPDMFGMKDYVGINSASMAGYYLGACCLLLGLSVIISGAGMFNAFIIIGVCGLVTMVIMLIATLISPMRKLKKAEAAKEDQAA